jgi:predicted kinase
MEAILLIGIQAAGKSTFYHHQFSRTHVRINLDMLRTRHREQVLLTACLETRQPFVVDNTNITLEARAKYIAAARAAGFRVVGYYLRSNLRDAIARNERRRESDRIPPKGIASTRKKLELPRLDEGFDGLHYVEIAADGTFLIGEWHCEVQ